jgi:subtilase family serine protease
MSRLLSSPTDVVNIGELILNEGYHGGTSFLPASQNIASSKKILSDLSQIWGNLATGIWPLDCTYGVRTPLCIFARGQTMYRFRHCSLLVCSLLATAMSATALAQSSPKVTVIRAQIDEKKTFAFHGNIRPEVTAENDRGPVSESMELKGMHLLLARSPESQAAFDQYLQDVTNPRSASFHKWLTGPQIGKLFGPSDQDVAILTAWMTSKGFSVHSITPDGTLMEFDGTASQVSKAFHSPIHNLSVDGVSHIANVTDPEIPEALAPMIAGVLPVNDFKPRAMLMKRGKSAKPSIAAGGGFNLIGAADLATIYNFNPLFKAGITGKGQTIVVVEDTDVWSVDDFAAFRKFFGLTRLYPTGNTMTQVHPTGALSCSDPGINGDDGEAAIDVEWASAAAPAAQIVLASCSDTSNGAAGFGGFIALDNMLNTSTPPTVVSISYGESESENGATSNLFISNLYQLAAAEGVSVFVSSGDEGAASSDADLAAATHGIAVSGWTSTPYNVSVGGTDYGDTFLGETSTYFTATDGPNYLTAKSYVPEIPWNDSCASQLLYLSAGFSSPVGPAGYCNSAAASEAGEITTASGSGGPSGCATGVASTRGVVSGTCAGYAKPSWQAGLIGNPADGVRDIPDVSLFAANGVWGHYYAVCYSDTNTSRTEGDAGPCTGDPSTWAGFGGTSVSSPIWAGIQALVNQRTGQTWGNPNPVLYGIANTEYGASGNFNCNSTLGNGAGANCVFYDVTLGDMDVNCTQNRTTHTFINCFNAGGTEGALSVSNTVLQPAYSTSIGWDFATGIGTTNAYNLVNSPAWGAP